MKSKKNNRKGKNMDAIDKINNLHNVGLSIPIFFDSFSGNYYIDKEYYEDDENYTKDIKNDINFIYNALKIGEIDEADIVYKENRTQAIIDDIKKNFAVLFLRYGMSVEDVFEKLSIGYVKEGSFKYLKEGSNPSAMFQPSGKDYPTVKVEFRRCKKGIYELVQQCYKNGNRCRISAFISGNTYTNKAIIEITDIEIV